MNKKHFKKSDIRNFWDDNEYALKEYISKLPTDELIKSIENELGYKLPASYIELMKVHNGGTPFNNCFPTQEPTSWAEDHIAITGIFGIGRKKSYSLCGSMGSQFMIDEWGYPNIGVYICDCPSAGHDMVALDYSKCGKNGEPQVVHVDQESDYKITLLAKDFETFIKGLVNKKKYDTSKEDEKRDIKKIENGKFSELLEKMCDKAKDFPQISTALRNIVKEIVKEKGSFNLHADELSYLMYDILFFLYENLNGVKSKEEYLEIYPSIIVFEGEFNTGGYAPDFVEEWFDKHIKNGFIETNNKGFFIFKKRYLESLIKRIAKYQK